MTDWDPFSREAYFARRASNTVRRTYGIEHGDVSRLKQYDAEVERVYQQMLAGDYRPKPERIPPTPKQPRTMKGLYMTWLDRQQTR